MNTHEVMDDAIESVAIIAKNIEDPEPYHTLIRTAWAETFTALKEKHPVRPLTQAEERAYADIRRAACDARISRQAKEEWLDALPANVRAMVVWGGPENRGLTDDSEGTKVGDTP